MSHDEKVNMVRARLTAWAATGGHAGYWYYPEIFHEIGNIVGADTTIRRPSLTRAEFEAGCWRFTNDLYGAAGNDSGWNCGRNVRGWLGFMYGLLVGSFIVIIVQWLAGKFA